MEIEYSVGNTDKVWKASIDELMRIFRDALVSLAPILDRAHISYIDGEQYDDFDAISEALFESLVISSIKWSFSDPDEIAMPTYGFAFDEKTHNTFIEVRSTISLQSELLHAFVCFSSKDGLFDTAVCHYMTADPRTPTETVYADLKDCRFFLRHREANQFVIKSELIIPL